jgi:hypothetical protein
MKIPSLRYLKPARVMHSLEHCAVPMPYDWLEKGIFPANSNNLLFVSSNFLHVDWPAPDSDPPLTRSSVRTPAHSKEIESGIRELRKEEENITCTHSNVNLLVYNIECRRFLRVTRAMPQSKSESQSVPPK